MAGLYKVEDPSQKALRGMEGGAQSMSHQQFMKKDEKSAGGGLMSVGSGAATGAAAGSIIPGVGTAVGAVAGAVIGGLSYYLS